MADAAGVAAARRERALPGALPAREHASGVDHRALPRAVRDRSHIRRDGLDRGHAGGRVPRRCAPFGMPLQHGTQHVRAT